MMDLAQKERFARMMWRIAMSDAVLAVGAMSVVVIGIIGVLNK